jgi:hypothetical protein
MKVDTSSLEKYLPLPYQNTKMPNVAFQNKFIEITAQYKIDCKIQPISNRMYFNNFDKILDAVIY